MTAATSNTARKEPRTAGDILREVRKMRAINKRHPRVISPEREKQLVTFYGNFLERHGYDRRNPSLHSRLAQLMTRLFSGAATRGILLHGCTGSGKTIAMQLIREYFRMRWFDATGIALWGQAAGRMAHHLAYITEHDWQRPLDVVVDDLGTENTLVDYGNRCEPVAEYLMARYKLYRDTGVLTHVVTNLDESDLVDRYGERLVSRLNEMCCFVDAGNTDWRHRAE